MHCGRIWDDDNLSRPFHWHIVVDTPAMQPGNYSMAARKGTGLSLEVVVENKTNILA